MKKLIIKENYQSKLNLLDTELAIKFIKDTFESELAKSLCLTRVSAPLFVLPQTGLNDDLNGHERPVSFDICDLNCDVEIVQSLAKWKRNALKKYNFLPGNGLYTDMNAIRRDEELDSFHSVYVDQWDWEKIILKEERNLTTLKQTVKKIYRALLQTEQKINKKYSALSHKLPDKITFISSTKLLKLYPTKTSKERENLICKEFGAVFIYEIGWALKDGYPHDGRACDYDDWRLNGDLLVWCSNLDCSMELSSMGIRVDAISLINQATYKNEFSKLETPYAKAVIDDYLPFTIGGGIGQSRLCLFFLEKVHIGEVQSSVWSDDDIKMLEQNNIHLL